MAESFKAILVSDKSGKVYHNNYRKPLVTALVNEGSASQFGGLPNRSVAQANLVVKLF